MPLAEALIVLLLIVVNGVLAMSELALMSSRRGRLEQLAQAGDRGARAALRLLDDPTQLMAAYLATAQAQEHKALVKA